MRETRKEQELFWQLITAPLGVERGQEQLGIAVTDLMAKHAHVSSVEAMNIYANAYFYRIHDTAVDLYPLLRAYLGEQMFWDLWTGYLHDFPPRSYSLRKVGLSLTHYVRMEKALFRDFPATEELIKFEQALIQVFDAGDAPVQTAASLQEIPATDLMESKFTVSESWQLQQHQWNVPAFWETVTAQADRVAEPIPLSPLEEPGSCLIWRQNENPHFQELTPVELAFYSGLACGEDFTEICMRIAKVTADPEAVPGIVQASITDACEREIISGVIVPD